MKLSTWFSFIMGLSFFLVGALMIFFLNLNMKKDALSNAEEKAHIILNRNLSTHLYFSHKLKPKLFDLTEPVRDDHYFEPTWMSSTYAIREIDKTFQELMPSKYYYKECAINARSPENEADPFERIFINELNKNPELHKHSQVRILNGSPYFILIHRGEAMEKSCLRCHSTPDNAPGGLVDFYGPHRSFDRKEGEVVSAISIRIPLTVPYAEANRLSWELSTALFLALIFLFGLQFFLANRLIFRPLSGVRSKANEIAADSEHLGEMMPLPKGRELEELTVSFNTMSSALRKRSDEIKVSHENLLLEVKERKKAEEKTAASLREKELLIKEIYHRTRNNMQVVSSLLELRSKYLQEKSEIHFLRSIKNQIQSMALVHQKLYESKDLSRINLKDYIKDLSMSMFNGYNISSDKVLLNYSLEDVDLSIDCSVSCGLVLHEIISNCFTHAFPKGNKGEISITLSVSKEKEIEISVADNGIGLPEGFDIRHSKSLGMQIIANVVDYQLKGAVEVKIEKGAEFKIKFKEVLYKKRI